MSSCEMLQQPRKHVLVPSLTSQNTAEAAPRHCFAWPLSC